MKMPQMNKKQSFLCLWVEKVRQISHFCDVAPSWTFPSENETTCNCYSRDHTASL